jgi:hypothetical protein
MGMVGAFVLLSAFLAVSTLRTFTSEALAQSSVHSSHEPGLHLDHESGQASEPVLNGSLRPEDIPDSVAIRALMQTLRVPSSPDTAGVSQVRSRTGRMNLSETDFEILVRELGDFDTQAKAQEARIEAVRPSSVGTVSAASTRFLEDRYVEEQATLSALIEDHYQQVLESLSPEGAAKLREHLFHVKSRIKVYAVPDMSRRIL